MMHHDRPPDKPRSAVSSGSTPLSAGPFGVLGEPHATYARLLLACDEAKKKLHAAQIAGEPNARAKAEVQYEAALCELDRFRHHCASTLLLFARFASELFPGMLAAILDPIFRRELDTTQDAIREHEDRVEELEDTVAAIACGEAVAA